MVLVGGEDRSQGPLVLGSSLVISHLPLTLPGTSLLPGEA